MALNRLSRDMILNRALDMIDSPALDNKDRQDGLFHQNALSLGWLQDGIDHFQRKYPYGAQVTFGSWSVTSGANTSAVPSNYLLDMRNGISITSPTNFKRRLIKISMQKLRNRLLMNSTPGTPRFYTILGSTIYYDITADQTYTGTLAYYKQEETLDAQTVPFFPDDYVLIEFVRLRGREWVEAEPAGTAIAYADTIIAKLRAAGLGQEGEETDFPLDPERFHPSGNTQIGGTGWMGDTVRNG